MFQETSGILIALFWLIFLVFLTGLLMFVRQSRRNRMLFNQELALKAEQHKRELLESQLDTQKETMQHIGQEIHDNVGQKLTLASLYARQYDPGQSTSRLEEIAGIIDESLKELRQLSKTLTHPETAGTGLLAMLRSEAKKISTSGICFVEIIADEVPVKLSLANKNIVFRLLQEFFQNSLKHARCRKITVTVNSDSSVLCITATDDGTGFDTSLQSTGIGLLNMKRRAEQLNASYKLESSPDSGTRLTLKLPLPNEL